MTNADGGQRWEVMRALDSGISVHEEQRRKAQIRKVFANARAIVTPLASLCPDEYPFWLLRLRKRVAVELGTAKV